jgi:hypothetical protein
MPHKIETKKNRLEKAVFYMQASVRPRPAHPCGHTRVSRDYAYLTGGASIIEISANQSIKRFEDRHRFAGT